MLNKKLEKVCQFVEVKTGINLASVSSKFFEEVIKNRLDTTHLVNPEDYLLYLQKSSKEFEELVEAIVIPETWFFRESRVFDYLIQYIKRDISEVNKISKPFFNFLSLPCSTGEEPYSIAIALQQAQIPVDYYQIDAIDISSAAIQKAKKGMYSTYSFREKKQEFITPYFAYDNREKGFSIKPFVKKNITFITGNAIDKEFMDKQRAYDVIFCRNLLIYLTSLGQEKLLSTLYKHLKLDGRLIVAPAERRLALRAGFIPEENPYSFILCKSKKNITHGKSKSVPIKTIEYPSKEWHKKTKAVIQNNIQEAIEWANQGELDKAEKLCHLYLAKNHHDAEPYYLLGVIEGVKGNDKVSEQYFLKAVYLNPNHYEALIHLALIAENKNKMDQGKLFRLRAQKALKSILKINS